MTPDLHISQALLVADARGVRAVAHSDGFDVPEAERIVVLFGPRPAGVACPLAHFACPFGRNHVAVVQVAERPGSGSPLAFRFLVLGRDLYRHLGDPFAIADRYPPDWAAGGPLPALAWPLETLPKRTVDVVQAVLKDGDMALLLGSAQALVDGGRVVIQRPAPDEPFLRGLWQLLPDRTRAELWPASFAFSDELGFHAVAMPTVPADPARVRHTEDGLRDYPQSSYELGLQIAAEAGDQRDLDRLFARRTSGDTIRLGLAIIGVALVLAVLAKFVMP
ncbi:MAG: hypothetical protein JWO38_655 [Gemmataceae bacterium]|nr:hypothetical protein [Gemmataceae bacterium]